MRAYYFTNNVLPTSNIRKSKILILTSQGVCHLEGKISGKGLQKASKLNSMAQIYSNIFLIFPYRL